MNKNTLTLIVYFVATMVFIFLVYILFGFLYALLPLALLVGYAVYARLDKWLEARSNGLDLSPIDMGLMRFKQIPVDEMIAVLTKATKANLGVSYEQLERHYLSGGNVKSVVNALITAKNAFGAVSDTTTLPKFGFAEAASIDLARKDVLEAIKTWVSPRVIVTHSVTAVAKDRIQLSVKARITIQTNFERYIGGTNEETIIARVGEGMISRIGEHTHEEVLENPESIADQVEETEKKYDKAAYKIKSIDIDEISVGKNIGVILDVERANADKKIAQANAEKRRSVAIAYEQEARAKAEESRANLIKAESEIPIAIAEALKTGKMGVMDYYNYKNLKADTDMRESVSKNMLPPPSNQHPFDNQDDDDEHHNDPRNKQHELDEHRHNDPPPANNDPTQHHNTHNNPPPPRL